MKRSKLLVGAAVAAVALLVMTACAPRGDAAAEGEQPIAQEDLVAQLPAATKPVDTVTWSVVEGEPATLDPVSSANLIVPNLCDNLLALQPDFSIRPGVATKAEWVDPVTFVIELRDDVTFWDGTPLTPADVVYSLERNRVPESQWFGAFALVNNIAATGEHEVTVTFNAPDSTFREAIAGQGGAIMSAAFGAKVGTALGTSDGGLMCSGPYALADNGWTPGRDIVTTANPDYWRGAPLVQTLTYVFVADTSTLATALTEGEIDGALNVSPTSRAVFTGDGAGSLIVGPSTASFSVGPATPTGPAANPAIRRALSLAIDREQYIDTVLNGLGQEQRTIVPPFSFAELGEANVYEAGYEALAEPEVDLDAAKQLIAESGEDVTAPLVLAVPAGSTEFKNTAQIVQSAAKQIGLTITIDEKQPSVFGALFYDPSAREGIDFVATQGYLETPGVLGYPSLFMLPEELGGVFNWSGYANSEVTSHMQAARTATDATTAAREFVAAQEIFAPDMLQITLAGAYQLSYLNDELTGITSSVAMYSSPWALHLGAK